MPFLLALGTSCADSAGPVGRWTFGLVSIDGDPLPASSTTIPDGEITIADTLCLETIWMRTGTIERRITAAVSGETNSGTFVYEFVREGNAFVFQRPHCPLLGLCGFTPHEGRLEGDTFTITYAGGLNRPRVYRLVR